MELNAEHIRLLDTLAAQYHNGKTGVDMPTRLFTDNDRVRIAHLIQLGLVCIVKRHDELGYAMSLSGLIALDRLRNPTNPAETLRAEIAALERQLADKRAALGALESGERPDSEALVNRGIASQFHEG